MEQGTGMGAGKIQRQRWEDEMVRIRYVNIICGWGNPLAFQGRVSKDDKEIKNQKSRGKLDLVVSRCNVQRRTEMSSEKYFLVGRKNITRQEDVGRKRQVSHVGNARRRKKEKRKVEKSYHV